MPDLRQPASYQEIIVNRAKWDALPKDLQAIVKWAGMAEIIRMTAYSVDQDSKAIEELVARYGFDGASFEIVHYGIEPDGTPRPYGGTVPRLLCVGRLIPIKGHIVLLRAFAAARGSPSTLTSQVLWIASLDFP